MKKILLPFVFLFSLTAISQVETTEADIDTLTVDFRVISISGDIAKIMTSNFSKNYEVSVRPEINPFGYILEVDREYTISLERDKNQVYALHTRGQTGTVPGRMLWFAVSKNQLARDMREMKEFTEEPPGYDRSPRYH
jgi:hypothetical protein